MAQNLRKSVPALTWTMLTDANITAATLQVFGHTRIAATLGTSAPAAAAAYIEYSGSEGEVAITLADMFPGVSGANRLWAFCFAATEVTISHA